MCVRAFSTSNVSETTSAQPTGTDAGSPDGEQRGGLHLDGDRARRAGRRVRVVEQVDAHDRAGLRLGRGADQRLGEPRVGEHAIPGGELARGAVEADRLARDHQLAERETRLQRAAGADADRAPRAELDQLCQDDRRRGAAHARGLDRQRRAVGARGTGVAPEAAVVVEHQRLLQQRLRECQRAPGVAGQEDALGQRRGGAQVDRLGVERRGGVAGGGGVGRALAFGLGLWLRHGRDFRLPGDGGVSRADTTLMKHPNMVDSDLGVYSWMGGSCDLRMLREDVFKHFYVFLRLVLRVR